MAKVVSTVVSVGVIAGGYGAAIYRSSHAGSVSPSTTQQAAEERTVNDKGHFSFKKPSLSVSSGKEALQNAVATGTENVKEKIPEIEDNVKEKLPEIESNVKNGIYDVVDKIDRYGDRKSSEFQTFMNDYPDKVTISDNYGVLKKVDELISENKARTASKDSVEHDK